MRWYAVAPTLPEKAVLRIRSAPSSDADVCGSIAKGRVIAALSPEFEIDQPDGSEPPQRWLHVTFHDEETGESVQGYVMAAFPDGVRRLLVPWEDADYIGCGSVLTGRALLYEDALSNAAVIGVVNEDDSIELPFGVSACESDRYCIEHDVFGEAWIGKTDIQLFCELLEHPRCAVKHAFFSLDDQLPPEAQVALRSFPSTGADALGLFSRGEVVECVSRCGDWMQISRDGQQWIMWRTSSMQLLTEIPHHLSSSCQQPQNDVKEPAAQESGDTAVDGVTDSSSFSVGEPDVPPHELSPRLTTRDSSTFVDIVSTGVCDTSTQDSPATDPEFEDDVDRNPHSLEESYSNTEVTPTAGSLNEDSVHRDCSTQITPCEPTTTVAVDHKPDVNDTLMEECETQRGLVAEVIAENNEVPVASDANVGEPLCQLNEGDGNAKAITQSLSSEDQDANRSELNHAVSSDDFDGEPEMEVAKEAAPVWSWDERPLNVGRKVEDSVQPYPPIVATASWDDRPLNIGRNNPFNSFYEESLKTIDTELPGSLCSASYSTSVRTDSNEEEKTDAQCSAIGNDVVCERGDDGDDRGICKSQTPDGVDNASQKSTEAESDLVPSEGSAATDPELEPKAPVQTSIVEAVRDWSWDDAPIKSRFSAKQTHEMHVEDTDEVEELEALKQSTSPERLSVESSGDVRQGRPARTTQPSQTAPDRVQLASRVDDEEERSVCADESVQLVFRFNDEVEIDMPVAAGTSAVTLRPGSSKGTEEPNLVDGSTVAPAATLSGGELSEGKFLPLEPARDTVFVSRSENEVCEDLVDEELAEGRETHDDSISARLTSSPLPVEPARGIESASTSDNEVCEDIIDQEMAEDECTHDDLISANLTSPPLTICDQESSNTQHDNDADEVADTEESQVRQVEIMELTTPSDIRRDETIDFGQPHEGEKFSDVGISTFDPMSDCATTDEACHNHYETAGSEMGEDSSHQVEDDVGCKLIGIRTESSPTASANDFSSTDIAPQVTTKYVRNGVKRRVDAAPNTRAPSKLYTAINEGDNPDDMLRALADETTEFDGWLRYEPPSLLAGQSSFQEAQNLLDVLYSRNGSNDPFSTPTKQRPGTVQASRTPCTSTPRERLTAILDRTPSKHTQANAHGLIMGSGEPEQILAAQFGKSSDELDLFSGYVYPELSSSRAFSTSSVSGDDRPSSPAMIIPAIERASSFSTPVASKVNPLKRTASAIAKTPPVALAKSDNAPTRLTTPAIATAASRDTGSNLRRSLQPPTRMTTNNAETGLQNPRTRSSSALVPPTKSSTTSLPRPSGTATVTQPLLRRPSTRGLQANKPGGEQKAAPTPEEVKCLVASAVSKVNASLNNLNPRRSMLPAPSPTRVPSSRLTSTSASTTATSQRTPTTGGAISKPSAIPVRSSFGFSRSSSAGASSRK